MFDWELVTFNGNSLIEEINEIVASFNVLFQCGPSDFKIDILKTKKGGYYGRSNYSILWPDHGRPGGQYTRTYENIEYALNGAVNNILLCLRQNFDPDYIFWMKHGAWDKNNQYYDGNGNTFTKFEVEILLKEYRNKD